MALKKMSSVQQIFVLPPSLDPEPTASMQTWTAKQVTTGNQRVLMELVTQLNMTSNMSMYMLQAYLTYVETSITIIDEKGNEGPILAPAKDPKFSLNKFISVWTNDIPQEIQDWIILECVWRLNPQWRPEYVTEAFYAELDEEREEEMKKFKAETKKNSKSQKKD